MKPRFCLLDAGPIIELHRLGVWDQMVERAELVIPSVVAGREVEFWDSGEGVGKPIDLSRFIESGAVEVMEADAQLLQDTLGLFDPTLVESVHLGELEALALLKTWQGENPPSFCTGDRLATVALCLLGFSELAVSLEAFLDQVGLSRKLRRQFRRDAMNRWVEEGRHRVITGEGLR
ncbi:MAG: hypothetical protein K8R59_03565 [Thermoanaerobaculales bacterium]|nr:hypothetical protein [Thermoanaerobaculales bacterium]